MLQQRARFLCVHSLRCYVSLHPAVVCALADDVCGDALLFLQDFVSAVMDVDYSPTGREFVAGGYDRSVRIFNFNAGHSREVGPLTGQCIGDLSH